MRGLSTFWIVAAALGTTVGCSPDPVNQTHTGSLATGDSVHPDDQSLYDEYVVKVGSGYRLTVTMESSDFDAYLHIHGPNGGGYQDDDDGGGTNARVEETVDQSGDWRVWANSATPGETGNYRLTIVTTKP